MLEGEEKPLNTDSFWNHSSENLDANDTVYRDKIQLWKISVHMAC